jgi:hypothetical protein
MPVHEFFGKDLAGFQASGTHIRSRYQQIICLKSVYKTRGQRSLAAHNR